MLILSELMIFVFWRFILNPTFCDTHTCVYIFNEVLEAILALPIAPNTAQISTILRVRTVWMWSSKAASEPGLFHWLVEIAVILVRSLYKTDKILIGL